MADYQIFTDATADLSYEMLKGLPPVEILPMHVEIGGGLTPMALPEPLLLLKIIWICAPAPS